MSSVPNLQSLLNDPNRPGESRLSLLFTAGLAGLTFQELIFGGLHIDDAMNLRCTCKRLNDIVKGHVRYIQHETPGGFPILGIHNSTLLWLGRKCNGIRFPGRHPCPVTPLTEGEARNLFNCDGIPPPLDAASVKGRCCGETCRTCKVHIAAQVAPQIIAMRTNAATSAPLCIHCTRQAVRRYPRGHRGCICMRLRNGHRCHVCDTDILTQLQQRAADALAILKHVHKSRQGGISYRPRSPPLGMVPCPGCGGVHYNRNPNAVAAGRVAAYCLACNGITTQATIGSRKIANNVVSARITRRSQRIVERMQREPTIGLAIIQHPLQN